VYQRPRRVLIHQDHFLNANLHRYTGQHQHMHCNEYASFRLTIIYIYIYMYKFQVLHSIKYGMSGQMVNDELYGTRERQILPEE
jgi:hypothetical protein